MLLYFFLNENLTGAIRASERNFANLGKTYRFDHFKLIWNVMGSLRDIIDVSGRNFRNLDFNNRQIRPYLN